MGRPPRIHFRNAIYHAMGRGNGGELLFRSDDDCLVFLGILENEIRRAGCIVLAYCLMRNHFHLLIQVADVPLSEVMRRLLCRYARSFNATHKRRGHLFQSRFKAKLCARDSYLTTVLRYIHNNPVKAGLVKDPAEWPWSSHRQFISKVHSTLLGIEAALGLLATDPETARHLYRKLMGEPDENFCPRFDASSKPTTPPKGLQPRMSLSDLAESLQRETGKEFNSAPGKCRPRERTRFRREFARRAARLGHAYSEIARYLGVYPSAVSQYLGPTGQY